MFNFGWFGKSFARPMTGTQCTPGRDACLTGVGFADEYGEMAYSDYATIVANPAPLPLPLPVATQPMQAPAEEPIPWTWPVPAARA